MINTPTAPAPLSTLSAFILEPAFKLICVSALPVEVELEFISKPTTVLTPSLFNSVVFKVAVTVFPDNKLTLAFCTARFFTNTLALAVPVPLATAFLLRSWSILYADNPSIAAIL